MFDIFIFIYDRLKRMECFTPERSTIANFLPCKSSVFAPSLDPIVRLFIGATSFEVARTTIKKLAPAEGAAEKTIWSSDIVNDVTGS